MVERHHAERAVAPAVAVLERLRPARRPGRRGASAGRPSAGRSCRRCRASAPSRARRGRARPACSGPSGSVDRRRGRRSRAPQSLDAVVELVLREPPRERDRRRRRPTGTPSRGGPSRAGCRARSRPDRPARASSPPAIRPHARQELAVGEPGQRLELRDAARRRRAARCARFIRRRSQIGSTQSIDRVDDRRVAGAPAEMPREQVHDLRSVGGGAPLEEVGRRHQDPGRAEAALERVVAWKRLLQRRQRAVARPAPRRSRSRRPSACTASMQAARGPRRRRARTVQAPQTPCSQPTCVPVSPSRWRRKSESRSRGSTVSRTRRPLTVSSIVHVALRIARSTSTPVSLRRYRAEAWMESCGSTSRAASAPASRRSLRSRAADEQRLDLGEHASAGRRPRRRRRALARSRPSGARDDDRDHRQARSRPRAARAPRRRRAHRPARPARRRLDDELARRERRRVVRDEEVVRGDRPAPAGPSTTTVPRARRGRAAARPRRPRARSSRRRCRGCA